MRTPARQTCTVAVLATALTLAAHGADDPTAQARQILEAAGVRGGVVVHLGCGDGQLTAALRANDGLVVHGLDTDAANVTKARAHIRTAGLDGPVSADRLTGGVLPYTDSLVNLVVAEGLGAVPMAEVIRVLAPNRVAYVQRDGAWTKTAKPRPGGMDEWTHYLHSPNGNAVSQDRHVTFLRLLQWIGGPRYGRHHDHMSSANAMVSAGGRVFAIFDHASPMSIQLPSRWQLVARDAFNGTVLWRRKMGPWFSQMQRLKSGPPGLPRRLVAIGDSVFVTLALNAPVVELDAATGTTRRTYAGTQGANEMVVSDGVLFLVVNREGNAKGPLAQWPVQPRTVMAVQAATGKVLWQWAWPWVLPGCMAVDGRRVVFFDGERVVALDRTTGKEAWQSAPFGRRSPVPVYFAPCLVLHDDLVFFSGADLESKPYHADHGKTMYALAAATGKTVWKAPHAPSGYRSAEDILVLQGLVWTSDIFNSKEFRTPQTGMVWGRDPRTGEVKVKFMPDVKTHWFHHRCYRAKATERYLLTSRTGIEFVDVKKKHWTCHHWVRGGCLYGVMPANGMVYNPPHPCACYLEAKLYGFNALAPHSAARQAIVDAAANAPRLERGPAYAVLTTHNSQLATATDWPMLRHDPARSGATTATVPAQLKPAWTQKLGGRLSSVVVAEGKLFVAAIDAHTVHALDAATGKPAWAFTAGGRVDSPPTIWRGRCLFGSADGHVYCLWAADGQLAWRYRAVPADLRMGAFGQLESVWPVHGSVLVRGGELWAVAGRSMFVDGGLRLLRLNPATGERIAERVLDDRVPGGKANLQAEIGGLNMPVALPDVLVSDGQFVYMRSQQFDAQGKRIDITVPMRQAREQKGETAHLFCPTGLLDDAWWHRSYWVYGRVWKSGAGGYFQSGRFAPSGRPMVFDGTTVYSFGRQPQYYRWTTAMEYMLYASPKQPKLVRTSKDARRKGKLGGKPGSTIETRWKHNVPVLARAMVLAGRTLFLAGPRDLVDETKTLRALDQPATQKLLARQAAALEGREGAVLWAASAADGTKLSEQKLDLLPVFDGLIAVGGRLYYAATDGSVVCLAGAR